MKDMRYPSSSSSTQRIGSRSNIIKIKTKATKKTTTTTPCCSKVGIKRGPWTPKEDELLANYIKKEGGGRWRTLPKWAGLMRCGKSCRLRWMNYLRPCVKRGRIAPDEEDLILRLHRLLGNRWSLIAGRIPGRTDNEIKNYWNTHLRKKLISQGIDPRTHKPLNPNPGSPQIVPDPNQGSNSNSSQLVETARAYRTIASKLSHNFKMKNLDHQHQNHVSHHGNGTEEWPNCDGVFMGSQGALLGESNAGDCMGNVGDEDTFSSFLDCLINDNYVFENQQEQQPNAIVLSPIQPVVYSSETFNIHNASIWETEVSMAGALGDDDRYGVLNNNHPAA